jgi:hypothetical protein
MDRGHTCKGPFRGMSPFDAKATRRTMQKKSGLIHIFYMIGTLVIAAMLVVVAINFVRDARVLQKPLLSTSAPKKSDTGKADGYKTIKYKKPAADSVKKSEKPKTTTAPASTEKPAEKPSTPSPNP